MTKGLIFLLVLLFSALPLVGADDDKPTVLVEREGYVEVEVYGKFSLLDTRKEEAERSAEKSLPSKLKASFSQAGRELAKARGAGAQCAPGRGRAERERGSSSTGLRASRSNITKPSKF